MDSKKLMIPEMYWDFCHTNVIVMERMNGVSIGRTKACGRLRMTDFYEASWGGGGKKAVGARP